MVEMQGSTMRRCATNGVDKCHLDELVHRKHVKIHWVHRGNKWMGSLDLDELNNVTHQTAGWGKTKNKMTTNKWRSKNK